jgi:hypothetical protein
VVDDGELAKPKACGLAGRGLSGQLQALGLLVGQQGDQEVDALRAKHQQGVVQLLTAKRSGSDGQAARRAGVDPSLPPLEASAQVNGIEFTGSMG